MQPHTPSGSSSIRKRKTIVSQNILFAQVAQFIHVFDFSSSYEYTIWLVQIISEDFWNQVLYTQM